MTKTRDFIQQYPTYNPLDPARCRVRAYEGGGRTVVLLSELPGYATVYLVNLAEQAAEVAWERLGHPAGEIFWIRIIPCRSPSRGRFTMEEFIRRVQFVSGAEGSFSDAAWERLSRTEAEALIGEVLVA